MNRTFKALIFVFIALCVIYIGTSFSKTLSIRRVILLHGHPIEAFTSGLGKKYHTDKRYGRCYTVNGSKSQKYADQPTAVLGVCLKKNRIGMYYTGSVGLF